MRERSYSAFCFCFFFFFFFRLCDSVFLVLSAAFFDLVGQQSGGVAVAGYLLRGDELSVETLIRDYEAGEEGEAGGAAENGPHRLEGVGVDLDDHVSVVAVSDCLDLLGQCCSVVCVLVRHGRQGRDREQLGADFVLEGDAADDDAEGLAHEAEEGEHGDGRRHVFFARGGLECHA